MNNHTRDEWLAQIRQNPSDWQTMLIFADWLEDSGDLLTAEQWRFLAAMSVCGWKARVSTWPTFGTNPDPIFDFELPILERNSIRCMPFYPTTLAEVEAYLQASR